MKYIDYTWDLEPNRILFDEELDIDKLGWRHGDCFKVTNVNGRAMLVKLDPVEQFVRGHKVNTNEQV
jgi:anaerobic selenocysteine-containing dehydrogenase